MAIEVVRTRRSNRGFWWFVGITAVAGVVLVALIVVSRPQARRGAVSYAQTNVHRVIDEVEAIRQQDGLAAATKVRLQGVLTDLLFIDPDQSSNDSEVVSVFATKRVWAEAVRADTGTCFWARIESWSASSAPVFGTSTDCSANHASAAKANGWPSP